MQKNHEMFETMAVPRAILANAVPAIISMLVVILYNIADTYFVGQTNDPLQVAAVSLATPVFLLFMATGNLLGIGGTSVISRALGAKRLDYAKKVSAFCFYAAIGIGVIFIAIFWFCMPLILALIGTSKDTINYAREYLLYIAPSAPFVVVSTAFSNIMRAEGKSTTAMTGMLLGTIVNIILDPIMILGLNMGVTGAAIATLIGNIISTLYYLFFFLQKRSILSIDIKNFQAGDGILLGVLSIGIPAALNNVLMSLSGIILNNFMAKYGDMPIAAMGVAMKVNMIVVLLQIGLGAGIQPLLGYSYGAKNKSRFRSIIKYSLLYTTIMGVVLTILCWSQAETIVRSFIDNSAVHKYGIQFVKALLISGPIIGILFVFTNALQAIGAAGESLLLSISRQGLVFIPLIFLLDPLFGLTGIVFAQPAADYLSIFVSALLYTLQIKKWERKTTSVEEETIPSVLDCVE